MGVPLKASISPSAPAPPLKDTDFAAFATLDDMEAQHAKGEDPEPLAAPATPATALPPSAPRPAPSTTAPVDFGPIGSPPNYRSSQPTSPNGAFSPATSPRNHTHINGVNIAANRAASPQPLGTPTAGISTSPFSAPGTQTSFLSGSYSGGGGGFANMGMAASLGSGLAMMGGRKGWGDSADAASAGGTYSGLLSAQLASSLSGTRGTFGEYDISVEYDDFGAGRRRSAAVAAREVAVEDEEMEDFIPSSLTELLTPEERSRRMSRSHSGQHAGGISQLSRELAAGAEPVLNGGGGGGGGHRYSRSVPAPTLLGDLKSIWADTSGALPASPTARGGFASSRFDPYASGSAFADADGLSMSVGSAAGASSFGGGGGVGSPSNASAAFLPGLHHHYMSAKAKQAQQQQQQAQLGLGMGGIGRALRGASGPLFAPQAGVGTTQVGGGGGGGGGTGHSIAGNYMGTLGLPASASASSTGFHTHTHTHGNMQTTYRTTPSPFDLTQTMHHGTSAAAAAQAQAQQQQQVYGLAGQYQLHQAQQHQAAAGAQGAQGRAGEDTLGGVLSPSARALQAHAPGQSLPQGLAAGYSRIHALPPLTHLALSPPAGAAEDVFGSGGEWGAPVGQAQQSAQAGQGSAGGLEGMISRLSYSAAAARGGTPPSAGTGASGTPPPPGLTRNVSGSRYAGATGLLSPLSRPVMSKDDDSDDLFDMESG